MRPRKKVLIVAGNEIAGSAMRLALEIAGFRATVLADLRELDAVIIADTPDAAVVDVKDLSLLNHVVRLVGFEHVVALVDTEREAAETPAHRWVLRETGMMASLRAELAIATARKRGPKRAAPVALPLGLGVRCA